MPEDPEHSIEYGQTGTWQAGDIHWARCSCGWQSERTTDRDAVETETERHVADAPAEEA